MVWRLCLGPSRLRPGRLGGRARTLPEPVPRYKALLLASKLADRIRHLPDWVRLASGTDVSFDLPHPGRKLGKRLAAALRR